MGEVKYETIEDGELLKWDKVGIKLEGVLVSYRLQKTSKGDGNVYEIKTKDGIIPFFAPSLLHKKFQAVPIGNVVSVTFTKITKTGGGNDLKHFDVGHAEPTEANLKSVGVEMLKKVGEDGDEEINPDDIPV